VIGRNVRVHRRARGLSQSALARAIGVAYQQVQNYQGGINRIGGGRRTRIADALGVPLAALFEGVAPGGEAQASSHLHLIADPASLRLAQAFARVQDRDARALIVALVELMAGRSP
jgi:transcriptional regulator with XRE-family HTH domain